MMIGQTERRKATNDVIERYHHIFAVEDLELGMYGFSQA